MITFLVILAHLTLDILFGWTLLRIRPHGRNSAETWLLSVLLGMYVETLSAATLMFLGTSLVTAGITSAALMAGVGVVAFYRGPRDHRSLSVEAPKWYEVALLIAVGEKLLFAIWQLTQTNTFFDDALRHWSGRARSLFGQVNWSFDPSSPYFMGRHIGNGGYPLQTIVWRALTAKLNGEWNEIISRVDGLVFFVVVVATVWLAVWRFSRVRWLAAAAAFVVSAVPLHAWHAAAGYSDITVEAFVVASLAGLIRSEWFLSGVMAAGAAWSKNDGLLLYFAPLLASVILLQWRAQGVLKLKNVLWFLSGFATLAPWLIFNYSHSLGFTAGQSEFAWHSDALQLLWTAIMTSPTSTILWIAIFVCVVTVGAAMLKDPTGRALLVAFLICLSAIVFVFTSTSAYMFLKDETTIHRVLMQFSGAAILIVTYGLWLKTPSAAWSDVPASRRPSARSRSSRR